MIDIKTSPTINPAFPFDWSLTQTAKRDFVRHYHGNPCAAVESKTIARQEKVICMDDSLHTAVIHSLFTDRRAGRDVTLPLGQSDRRGWCGDEYFDGHGEYGSHLWLIYTTKSTTDIQERARFAAVEALSWMVATQLASRVDVITSWATDERLAINPRIWRSNDNVRPDYDVLWGTTIRRSQ